MPPMESMPWFTQLRCITSASRNSRVRVMSVPALAMSIWKRLSRLKRRWQKMTKRSQRKFHLWRHDLPSCATVILSVALSLTSIFVFMPLLFSASMSLFAATAAPPTFSLVFTISTLMIFVSFLFQLQNYEFIE